MGEDGDYFCVNFFIFKKLFCSMIFEYSFNYCMSVLDVDGKIRSFYCIDMKKEWMFDLIVNVDDNGEFDLRNEGEEFFLEEK